MPMRPCLGSSLHPAGHTLVRDASRCADCTRAKDRARGTSTDRGLGRVHRREALAQIEAVPYCERCGHTGSPDNPLTGQHDVARMDGGTKVTSTLCRSCNGADGGRIGHRARNF